MYRLQFAALASQIDKHYTAIQNAKKALETVGCVIGTILRIRNNNNENDNRDNNENNDNGSLSNFDLMNLYKCCQGIDRTELN